MKQIPAYTFEELEESVQEKVLDIHRCINTEIGDWYESTIDLWKERLAEIGFENAEISFSGFYSQGDGASFKADLDLDKLMGDKYKALKDEDTHFRFEEYRGYSHYRMFSIKQHNYLSSKEMDDLSDEFVDYLNEYHQDLCSDIYSDLGKEYDAMTSDEAVKETLIINEYHFLNNGTMV